jgi:hypothetical protein
MSNNNQVTMSLEKALERSYQMVACGIVPCISGATGTGKTEGLKGIVPKLKEHWNEPVTLLVDFPALKLPEHYLGFPMMNPATNKADFMPMDILRTIDEWDDEKGHLVVLNDELDKASTGVQNAVAQLILERKVNGRPISDKVHFMVAGNRKIDLCGGQKSPRHLKSRMWAVTVETTPEGFLNWGRENNLHPVVQAFVSRFPEHLIDIDPKRDEEQDTNPRNLTRMASFMTAWGLDTLDMETAEGFISRGIASEFCAFCRLIDELPAYEEIISNPAGALLPEKPSSQYAVASMVISRAQGTDADALSEYLSRLPVEMTSFAFRAIFANEQLKKHFSGCKKFTEFCLKHQDLFKMAKTV